MGSTQGKYASISRNTTEDLEEKKARNYNVEKLSLASHKKSTGQRYDERLCNQKAVAMHRAPQLKNNSVGSSGSSGSGGDRNWNGEKDGGRKGSSGSGSSGAGKEARRFQVQYAEEETVDGWPKWLTDNVPKEVLASLTPKSAENFVKIDKIGQGTYSNVYKARDKTTGRTVALKKVKFETSEPESVKFMAREIMILQKLDHPNVVKLEGLATSRMQYSLYLVFDFMLSDLAKIISRQEGRLAEPQVKCYMHQLLSGLQHCHDRGILHRDIKGSNLLIDRNGVLKIADFGLANYYSPNHKHRLTSRVVTLWYRAPELLLGATDYGVGIDLWSAGCLLAEMLAGRPIMPGRTEVEQLHRIFKLCGTPSEEYWRKFKLNTNFQPPKSYQPTLSEEFGTLPASSLNLLTTLLALDPAKRGSASSALHNKFFYANPLACDLSGLPVIPRDKDEPSANDQRKHRRSKMKHRTQTRRERWKIDPAVNVTEQEDPAQTKEEPEQDIFSPFALSKQKMSPEILGDHRKGINNIKDLPPLPVTRNGSRRSNDINGSYYRLNQEYRSASTREFRELNQMNPNSQFIVIDD